MEIDEVYIQKGCVKIEQLRIVVFRKINKQWSLLFFKINIESPKIWFSFI